MNRLLRRGFDKLYYGNLDLDVSVLESGAKTFLKSISWTHGRGNRVLPDGDYVSNLSKGAGWLLKSAM